MKSCSILLYRLRAMAVRRRTPSQTKTRFQIAYTRKPEKVDNRSIRRIRGHDSELHATECHRLELPLGPVARTGIDRNITEDG